MTTQAQPVPNTTNVSRALRVVQRIIRAERIESRALEKTIGRPLAQVLVLQELARSSADSLNELAERVLLHQSSVSVLLKQLKRDRLVTATRAPEDRRRVGFAITHAGLDVLERVPPTTRELLASAFTQRFPHSGDQREFADLLEAWAARAGIPR